MVDIMKGIESGAATPAFATAPYGDLTEVSGPPEIITIPDVYRRFFATDARSILVTLMPDHYNFIKNPSFREDAAGWEFGSVVLDDVLDSDSWVGNSLLLDGDGVLRYRDSGWYVYIGLTEDVGEEGVASDYTAVAQESPQWTFSAYFRGVGQVRLVMEGYLAEGGAMSPPINQDLVQVQSPETEPYGDPAIIDENGQVWTRNEPPFYRSLGHPQMSSTPPGSITTEMLMAPVVVDGRNGVWEIESPYPSQAPYYIEWGIPTVSSNPGLEPPGAKYIQDDGGNLYALIAPAPAVEPYYRSITPPRAEAPELLTPDKTQFPELYLYGTDLWGIISPIPDSAPYYALLGPVATVETDPATDPPGDQYVEKDGEVWGRLSLPYYTNTGRGPYQARVEGPWTDITDRDWQRLTISSSARYLDGVSFAGCSWMDARIEIRDAVQLRVSSTMLDPNEEVVAEYFDGAMSESEEVDDYSWEHGSNSSISWYYYDKRARTRWLWENLPRLVPANRPVQIFYHDYAHPYIPGSTSAPVGARHRITL